MDLQTCTNDQLVAEVEKRLGGNTLGFHGLYSTNQQDFREMWCDAMDRFHSLCNADFDQWNPARQVMLEAADKFTGNRVENRRRVFALNTTQLGREEDYR